ncbi:MAG: hypothetical protein ABIF71_10670 [Planctomycetota bacterium]
MEKRIEDFRHALNTLKHRYPAKRRVKAYSFISGLMFELVLTRWPQKDAVQLIDRIEHLYVDWNEFRVTSLKTIAKHLGLTVHDLHFIARVKRVLQSIVDAGGSFHDAFFKDKPVGECLAFLAGAGLDEELGAVALVTYLGRPVMPLPDDVLHVIKRLGLFPAKSSRQRVRAFFANLNEDKALDLYQTYRLLKAHAEAVCRPKDPDCQACGRGIKCGRARV